MVSGCEPGEIARVHPTEVRMRSMRSPTVALASLSVPGARTHRCPSVARVLELLPRNRWNAATIFTPGARIAFAASAADPCQADDVPRATADAVASGLVQSTTILFGGDVVLDRS